MLVSLRWLSEYVDLVVGPDELAEKLTMAGTEISSITRIGANWGPVYVAQVTGLRPHPNADRLQLVTVDAGTGSAVTVVCGAFNMRMGDKVPLATEGARLLDAYAAEPREFVLKATKIRGVLSEGMLASTRELGLGTDHEGILILDQAAQVGDLLGHVLGDTILDLDVTANRGDLLSMVGVAREVAALTGQLLREPDWSYPEVDPPVDTLASVSIADADLCHRYTATIIRGISLGPSPDWLVRRLVAGGVRAINNVVDITNYVMLELGQPLHAFDLARICKGQIVVRRAASGERLTTLDGVDRELSLDTLVIADAAGPVALAGVMGGANSEVTLETKDILLESANFLPTSIRRTGRRLRLTSEASKRFERGLPTELAELAARRATHLMVALCGGTAARGLLDDHPGKRQPTTLTLREAEVERLLGISYGVETSAGVLDRLGFSVETTDGGLRVAVPPHRLDVAEKADLIEEIARVVGYDSIPTSLPRGSMPEPTSSAALRLDDLLRSVLVGAGYSEIITHSLTDRDSLAKLRGAQAATQSGRETAEGASLARQVAERVMPVDVEPLAVINPLSSDASVLRTTAVGSALQALARNLRLFDRDVALFEMGRLYLPRDGDLPEERRVLTIACGAWKSGRELGSRQPVDFFDLKGVCEELLARLGVADCRFLDLAHPSLHTGRAAAIATGPGGDTDSAGVVGALGEIHPRVRMAFDIEEPALMAAIDLDALYGLVSSAIVYRPLPKFPSVRQDIAVVVAESTPAAAVQTEIVRAGGELVQSVELFDLYRGEPLPAGSKSLAFHINYQSPERTLTDADAAAIQTRIVQSLRSALGASIRE